MPNGASGKKGIGKDKSNTGNSDDLLEDFVSSNSAGNGVNTNVKDLPKRADAIWVTGPNGSVGMNRPNTPKEWDAIAVKNGWEKVISDRPTVYASYKIPGKNYEVIKDGKKVRLPYETYTRPTRNIPQVDPTKKPLEFNSNIGVYNPNTGIYTDPMTGKAIPSIDKQFKKGGMVEGYEVGGGIPSAGNVQKTTPTRPVVLNSGATMSSGSNVQKAGLKQPAPTTTSQNSFSLSPQAQNTAAAGLAAGTSALNSYNEKKQGDMTYGSNAYFDKRNKNNQTSDTIMSLAGTAGSAVNPLLGAAITALPAASKAITGADAYGVSDKGDTRLALGAMLNPATAYQSLGKGYKEIAKGNVGRGLAYMTPLGALMTNDQNRYEREKLKFENEQGQNQAEYNQAVQDTQAQGKYNVQNALAMRNEGIANYTSDDFVKDPTLKQAEFNAPGKNKTLTAFGLAKGGAVKGGTIKGSGTGTSDSIDAQVKENSFVVPAKNNRVAKTLREMMLGDDPDTMAKVKQGMGPKVKLSNGEHLFTPAERAKLEAKGVNLYDLAPEAEDSDKYSMGGYMKKRMMGYANGGDVTGSMSNAEYLRTEKAKIAAERAENVKRVGAVRADQIAKEKSERLNSAVKDLLTQQVEDRKQAEKDLVSSLQAFERSKKAYEYQRKPNKTDADRYDALVNRYVEAPTKNLTPEQKSDFEDRLLRDVEKNQAQLDAAKKKLDFTKNEANYINTKNLTPYVAGDTMGTTPKRTTATATNDPFGILAAGRGDVVMGADPYGTAKKKPMVIADEASPLLPKPAPSTAKKGASGTTTTTTTDGKKAAAPVYNPMMSDTFDPIAFANANPGEIPEGGLPASTPVAPSPASLAEASVALKPGVKAMEPIDPNNPLVTANEQAVTNSNVANPTGAKFSWQDGLGAAINYGIPLAQSIIGFNQLQKIGDRPVDKLDPDLVNAFDTSRNNAIKADLSARYGMSAEELAAFRMQNAALTNAGRYNARNFSGGSGANALNMERSVINDSFDRALQAKIADKNIQMQKQQNAYALQNSVNSLAQYKQEANRRLFNDDLAAFQQKTDAASGLMATGLSNLSDAAAADKRMREFRKMNSK